MLNKLYQIQNQGTKWYGHIFYGICMNLHAKTTVEIGTGRGYISMWLTMAMYELGGKHYAIDPKKKENMDLLKDRVQQWNYGRAFVGICAKSNNVKWERPIDFIFIDGDHNYDNVSMDIIKYGPYVKRNRYMALHDYNFHPGVRKACDEHISEKDWDKILLSDNLCQKDIGVLLCRRK